MADLENSAQGPSGGLTEGDLSFLAAIEGRGSGATSMPQQTPQPMQLPVVQLMQPLQPPQAAYPQPLQPPQQQLFVPPPQYAQQSQYVPPHQ